MRRDMQGGVLQAVTRTVASWEGVVVQKDLETP